MALTASRLNVADPKQSKKAGKHGPTPPPASPVPPPRTRRRAASVNALPPGAGTEAQTTGGGVVATRNAGAVAPVPEAVEGGALSLLGFVAMAVKDPTIDVAKLQALLTMQREILADEARTQFNQAMNRLQMRLPRIKKNGVVEYPVDKNKPDGPKREAFKFAKWEDVDAGIRKLLNEEGFSISFNTAPRVGDGGGLTVTGELLHTAGHVKTASMTLPLDTSGGKSNLQGYASSASFGSRYVTKWLLNLVFEGDDDDGVAGGKSYINTEMKQRITTLIREAKADLEKFLIFARAQSVDEILVEDYARVVNMLEKKKLDMAGAKPAALDGEGA